MNWGGGMDDEAWLSHLLSFEMRVTMLARSEGTTITGQAYDIAKWADVDETQPMRRLLRSAERRSDQAACLPTCNKVMTGRCSRIVRSGIHRSPPQSECPGASTNEAI